MLVDLVESGQILVIVGPHASRGTELCSPQHWLALLLILPRLSLNSLFRSFLRKLRASFPYEKACKKKKRIGRYHYMQAKILTNSTI
jgi:hypothetical protein